MINSVEDKTRGAEHSSKFKHTAMCKVVRFMWLCAVIEREYCEQKQKIRLGDVILP